ncbi:E3 ubiquitin-protein ligase TRIM21-like [Pseudoliparis swirei]|uniref:E3 ubiquitin-protein ligase TRIM21-like n=1 Tax=Pseudoliparis swirei TaxID=2059687 RepID=UPI0024BE9E62|nr:E3 ubiquitin-protein ligase TRIM21-like [Pseudoliparis swirei]
MSAASMQMTEDQFLCSICLDVFTDPVTTPCGHNFCKACITQHWNVNVTYQCPNCNQHFASRPEMKVNTFISEMAAQFRQAALEEECEGKQAEMKKTEAETKEMIKKRRLKIQELNDSVQLSEEHADREIAGGVQVLTALKVSVERSQAKLILTIKEKHRNTEKQAEGFIQELEQELCELEKRSTEVEQLSRSEDHLHLPQSLRTLKAAPPTKNWTGVRVRPPSYEGTVMRAVKQLKKTLSNQMKKLFEGEMKRVQRSAVDVTLDPDSAHPELILSDDGKQVKLGDAEKNLPDNPERFDPCAAVLAKQSFSSGRSYYEVQVEGKTKWVLGVVRESINRKRSITPSPQEGFWTICLRNENEYSALVGPPVRLSLRSRPQKVGVLVDYEEGLVSFYDVDAAALIYSFTGCCFTEKLFPFFSPGLNEGGLNSAPLIISPVDHTQ